jgi:hypothetical protein
VLNRCKVLAPVKQKEGRERRREREKEEGRD